MLLLHRKFLLFYIRNLNMSLNHFIGKSFVSLLYFHRLHQCAIISIRNCSLMIVPLKLSYSSKLFSSQLRFSSISSISNSTFPNSDDISSALQKHYGKERFSVNPLSSPKSPQVIQRIKLIKFYNFILKYNYIYSII